MNRLLTLVLAAILASVACKPTAPSPAPSQTPEKALASAQTEKPAPTADSSLKTDQDKVLYALGAAMGQKLSTFRLTESELEILRQGMADSVLGRPLKADLATYVPKIDELGKSRAKAFAAEQKEREKPFLDKAAAATGAVKKPSGLIYLALKAGGGATPKATDKVKVNYQGTLTDGTVFDSSYQRNEPMTIMLNRVIPCWTEGLQLMKVGGKAKIVCPSDLAYGEVGAAPKIKPGSALVFDVELLEIVK